MSYTLTLQPAAGVETYISSANATTNYGTNNTVYIGEWNAGVDTTRTLIKFDLSSLPAGATIVSATLSLYCNTDNSNTARTFKVYRVKRAWTESGATWNKYDGTNNWQTSGCSGANDVESTEIGSRSFTATETLNQYKDFALTPTTKDDLDLGNGWLIKSSTESDDQYGFATSDLGANIPKLVIVYDVFQDESATVSIQTTVTGDFNVETVPQETLVIQPASADNMIRSDAPTNNYATNVDFIVGEPNVAVFASRTLIKFDLSMLPDNAVINSAVLSLYCLTDYSSNARTFRVYRLKRSWVAAEATWNIYSTGNNWSTAGAFHTDDCEQTDIGSIAMSATEVTGEYKDFTLTPTTKSDLDLGNGWLIKADTETDDAYEFASSNNATEAYRPKLTITYTSYAVALEANVQTQVVVTGAFDVLTSGDMSGNISIQTTVSGYYETRVNEFSGRISIQTTVTGTPTGGTTVYDVPSTEELQITIGGVDYTKYATIDSSGILIENALTSRMDTATVTLVATTVDERTALGLIESWQEIIIKRAVDGKVRFAGYIVSKQKQPFSGAQAAHYLILTCQDYSSILDRTHVNVSYSSKTDAYIINNLMATYAPEFNGTTYVTSSKTIDTITFNRISVFAALQQLCEKTKMEWYVDENKCIHYFSKETYAAPFTLSDAGTADVAPYSAFSYDEDASQIKNRIFVYGGTYLSSDVTETFTGDASRTTWPLLYVYETLPVITVDAAAQLEGIDGVDDPTNVDVLCNSSQKVIKFTVAPSNTAVIVVTYKYAIPILIRSSSTASYNTYNRWFDHKIIDRNITSVEEAKLAGQALLNTDAFARESVRITTYTIGFRSGQIAHVVNGAIGIDDYFLIKRVTGRAISAADWTIEYTMELGEYHGDLIDLLRQWQRDHEQKMEPRDDEQLNELMDETETITVTDSVSIINSGDSFLWDTMTWDYGIWS